ncbi:MAG: DUF192 domain-containing protein, partial [bacterium]
NESAVDMKKIEQKNYLKYLMIVAALAFLSGCSSCGKSGGGTPAQSPSGMPVIEVGITNSDSVNYIVRAEVALTDSEHEVGLMNRSSLAGNAGMLFVFTDSQIRSFWMKNTLIPLDMIFVGADKVIVSISKNTVPLTTTSHWSAGPAKYVLEVNGGYCDSKNIGVGDTLTFEGY